MNKNSNKKLSPISRVLRNNMTKEERHLWYDFFKKLPITVNRQKVIGNFIVDFYVAEANLVVELDGSQHYENPRQIASDFDRDKFLESIGVKVLRYSNLEIQRSFESVCEDILSYISIDWGD